MRAPTFRFGPPLPPGEGRGEGEARSTLASFRPIPNRTLGNTPTQTLTSENVNAIHPHPLPLSRKRARGEAEWPLTRMRNRGAWITTFIVLLGAIFACPAPAAAMHLSEGILPVGWAGLWYVVAAMFVVHGLRTINRRRKDDPSAMAMIAMVGAGIFLISCMPVPIPFTGTCSHPCGTGWAPC